MQLVMTGLQQVLDYPARDMTITVEAGIRMSELQKILAAENQRLPIDVPLSERATLGGAIACNTSGPRRYGHGTWRDYVIGISAIDASGHPFKAGGRVVKNVAGYDLCKLLVGSLGTLGIITQVTLKLRPVPASTGWVWGTFSQLKDAEPALKRLLNSATRPVAVELLNAPAAIEVASAIRQDVSSKTCWLGIAVEGTERDVNWQLEQLQKELSLSSPRQLIMLAGDQQPLWDALTEFPVNSEASLTFEATMLPSRLVEFMTLANERGISLAAHAANGIAVGHLSDDVATCEAAATVLDPLHKFCHEAKGNLKILQSVPGWKTQLSPFGQPAGDWGLMRQLKQEMDPADLLNRGKLFGENLASGKLQQAAH